MGVEIGMSWKILHTRRPKARLRRSSSDWPASRKPYWQRVILRHVGILRVIWRGWKELTWFCSVQQPELPTGTIGTSSPTCHPLLEGAWARRLARRQGGGPRPEGYYDLRPIYLVLGYADDIEAHGLGTIGVIRICMPEVVNDFDRERGWCQSWARRCCIRKWVSMSVTLSRFAITTQSWRGQSRAYKGFTIIFRWWKAPSHA